MKSEITMELYVETSVVLNYFNILLLLIYRLLCSLDCATVFVCCPLACSSFSTASNIHFLFLLALFALAVILNAISNLMTRDLATAQVEARDDLITKIYVAQVKSPKLP